VKIRYLAVIPCVEESELKYLKNNTKIEDKKRRDLSIYE